MSPLLHWHEMHWWGSGCQPSTLQVKYVCLLFAWLLQETRALLMECLDTYPAVRPTAGQLVAHLNELVYPPAQPPPVSGAGRLAGRAHGLQ